MFINKFLLCFAGLALILCSCTAKQIQLSSPITASSDSSIYVLSDPVVVEISSGADTNLKSGTRWTNVGTIEQGKVYKTKDQVVTVNSFNVYEAFIVIRGEKLVGYYLPAEKTFVQAKPAKITLSKEGN